MSVELSKITLKIGEHTTLELTLEEVHELYQEFNRYFGASTIISYSSYPFYYLTPMVPSSNITLEMKDSHSEGLKSLGL